jgi:hypothetical protein
MIHLHLYTLEDRLKQKASDSGDIVRPFFQFYSTISLDADVPVGLCDRFRQQR